MEDFEKQDAEMIKKEKELQNLRDELERKKRIVSEVTLLQSMVTDDKAVIYVHGTGTDEFKTEARVEFSDLSKSFLKGFMSLLKKEVDKIKSGK